MIFYYLRACYLVGNWTGLPKRGFPVLFHSVIGEDMREERSPSFFNPSEVAVVINYVEELMATRKGGIKLKPEDIGIISPYRKQVCIGYQISDRDNSGSEYH